MTRLFAISLLMAALAIFPGGAGRNAQSQPPGGADGAELDLFYMGNRASRLESCGCHSKQQGGVQFEAVLYDRYAPAPSVRVDLGGWVTYGINTRPVELMMTRYLLRAMTMLKLDAVNIGLRDIELRSDFINDFAAKYPGQLPPLVSANVFLKDAPTKPAFEPYRIVEKKLANGKVMKVGITGVAWLTDDENSLPRGATRLAKRETDDYVARTPLECLAPVIKELRPKVGLLIVLSSGDVGSGNQIAQAFPDVDAVIARNAFEAPQVDAAQAGKVRILFGRNNLGKELGFAPLEMGADGKWQFKARPGYLPVNKDVEPKAALTALIEEFKVETHSIKPKLPPEDVKQVYAGALYCKMCHPKEYASWEKTKHAQAIATLMNKGQQFNPLCLKCHVTGFQTDNGFYAIDHTESQKLTNVQCEECHGPGLVHTDAQVMKMKGGQGFLAPEDYKKQMAEEKKERPHKKVPEATCLKCHTPENDDHFVYQEKLPKVMH